MVCPYVVSRRIVSQTTFEYDEAGNQSGQQILEHETAQFTKCHKESCGAWQEGRCAYRGTKSSC